METVLTRLTRTQVETLRARFPLAVKARAIIIRGSTVTFRVPDGAQIWDASPLHVARAITLSELHQGDPLKPGLITLGQRVVAVAKGGQHRDVRVLEDLANDNEEEIA